MPQAGMGIYDKFLGDTGGRSAIDLACRDVSAQEAAHHWGLLSSYAPICAWAKAALKTRLACPPDL